MVRGQTVVRRGALMMVRCIVGAMELVIEAEARSEGAVGEPVELRKRGERDTFFATISAPNEAILDMRK